MSPGGDDDREMQATRLPDDDTIEALLAGRPVHGAHASLATFAQRVRALGDEPVPSPSPTLAALLAGRVRLAAGSDGDGDAVPDPAPGPGRHLRRPALGRRAKRVLGTSLTAAGVVGLGAAGVLPAAANEAVRDAIEVVSPVEFRSGGDGTTTTTTLGDRVSADATGGSDGAPGVEGPVIADATPGATRPDPGTSVDESPGRSGDAGLARANETPAAPHAPDVAPSTVPSPPGHEGGTPGDQDGDGEPGRNGGSPDATPSSTVPERERSGDRIAGE